MKMIKRLLIANRGEIAQRIQTSCRVIGIESVAIYSEADADLDYVRYADHAFLLEGDGVKETYLNIEQIIAIAHKANVEAIHPGYGFLSENADFVRAVEDANLIFIGPSSELIDMMGDKMQAREKMESIGVPLLPGCHDITASDNTLHQKAKEMGFPVLIKASAGGGGRAMKISTQAEQFIDDLKSIRLEAKKLFGSDKVFIEKYLEHSKHLEVQVLSDQHQQHLHCFERDCSAQRRKQKVIEEAPAPKLDEASRSHLLKLSTKITREIDYLGAGTLEFIQDAQNPDQIYFLEMNTRIQVEHVVSEIITNIDLVSWQIRVCLGEKIPFTQSYLKPQGHAIELRVYAEDVDSGFFPSAGHLKHCHFPGLAQARWDYTYTTGDDISLLYDSMIGKLIVWDENRALCIQRAVQALEKLEIEGVKNNRHHLIHLLQTEAFQSGEITTTYIETHPQEQLSWDDLTDKEQAEVIATHLFQQSTTNSNHLTPQTTQVTELWSHSSLAHFRLFT